MKTLLQRRTKQRDRAVDDVIERAMVDYKEVSQ